MSSATATKPPLGFRIRSWLGDNALRFYAVIAFIYLLLPVAYTFAFSFNNAGRTNLVWNSFTLDNWLNPCGAPQVCPSVVNSITVALIVTLVSTFLGTLIAFSLVRYRFRGRSTTNLLIFLPMATPEVVLGSSLLALFLNLFVPLGFSTVVIAHIMFCISFVVVTVKARLASLDPRLEQAAMDLYASEREAFRRITLPLVAPGIAAAGLLAFSLSFDDFIITNFNSGQFTTFPKFVYVSATRGIPAQANVIASAMFFIALAIVLLAQLSSRRRKAA
ncbi:MAG: ABC transporter permease [Actinobacteria bacterium]|jgi:spermidine/putrescine transport system permease protein|nr:ABC transporter permease [Micrococcales bacterium]MCB0903691.1 ABC transporter permease [Actinomycetota bacterium]MCO5301414.1 ABC transporter permease [Candidatus Nanopelagicales bacterium]MCB9428918.1 ABC transporter permease [Actinomycetota bacterium]HPE12162.1 ABC transporter permease [Actinomycetota bacterium]